LEGGCCRKNATTILAPRIRGARAEVLNSKCGFVKNGWNAGLKPGAYIPYEQQWMGGDSSPFGVSGPASGLVGIAMSAAEV